MSGDRKRFAQPPFVPNEWIKQFAGAYAEAYTSAHLHVFSTLQETPITDAERGQIELALSQSLTPLLHYRMEQRTAPLNAASLGQAFGTLMGEYYREGKAVIAEQKIEPAIHNTITMGIATEAAKLVNQQLSSSIGRGRG